MELGIKGLVSLLSLLLLFQGSFSDDEIIKSLKNQVDIMVKELEKSNSYAEGMAKKLGALNRQLMLQQLFNEERIRSEGSSGIKQVRNNIGGTKSYHSPSHVGRMAMASIHNHANNIRTVGMGEFIGVLNGVEFRTRHNDYRLYMPSTTSRDYHATEDIPFPDVPPEVTEKGTLMEQVKEMTQWFKAWKEGNYTQRDYRKYFKPVLCYLEGTWIKNTKKIDEPFESDRHFVDASSWFDLQEKIRFTSYTGRKDRLENFAYLPTTIMEIINETIPVFAQWNYRILCHPLKNDLPLKRFRMVDDLGSRLSHHHTVEEQSKTRAARFQINPDDKDIWWDRLSRFGLLDKLMGEIPGKDNYPANLSDNTFGDEAFSMDPEKPDQALNAGYYHRWYKVLRRGAMGTQKRHRGFSDQNLFMAMTTQEKVAGMKLKVCKGWRNQNCQKYEQKWSYAIPLEIIYLTPLNRWNPYNITYKGDARSTEGKTVFANGRNGGPTEDKAFNGANSKTYYLTPNEFYVGTAEANRDDADTTRGSVAVLDPTGEVRRVRASGIRTFLPNIPGIGILRQRYPIMPIHAEGSTTWKELEAVQDFLMDSKTHARLFREPFVMNSCGNGNGDRNTGIRLWTGKSLYRKSVPIHSHEVVLSAEEVKSLKSGKQVTKQTSAIQGHDHTITIAWHKHVEVFYVVKCEGKDNKSVFGRICWDRHLAHMKIAPDQ